VVRSQLAAHVLPLVRSNAFHPEIRIWTSGSRIVRFSCLGHNEFATEQPSTEATANMARRPIASETGLELPIWSRNRKPECICTINAFELRASVHASPRTRIR